MIGWAPTYLLYPAAIIVSAIISMYAVKKIIFITRTRGIFDVPDNIRKIHGADIPSLGGIGIFIGHMVVAAFFMYHEWYYVMAASVILFFAGINDDIMNMRPSKKLLAQVVASAIPVFFAGIRITSLYGIGGIEELPYPVSCALTIFLCTFFINVFNFMDGIDGLACVLAILYTGILGGLFAVNGQTALACISLSLAGATAGLLYYNLAPAKIYMGDTGSMMLGFSVFVLSVLCIDTYANGHHISATPVLRTPQAAMMLVLALLFLPIYDAIRVFVLRAARGVSPLRADRTHLHYYLLDAGFTHSGAVLVIACSDLAIVTLTWLLQSMHPVLLLLNMVALTSIVTFIVYAMRRTAMKRPAARRA